MNCSGLLNKCTVSPESIITAEGIVCCLRVSAESEKLFNPRTAEQGHFYPPLLPDFASNILPLIFGTSNIYVILKDH